MSKQHVHKQKQTHEEKQHRVINHVTDVVNRGKNIPCDKLYLIRDRDPVQILVKLASPIKLFFYSEPISFFILAFYRVCSDYSNDYRGRLHPLNDKQTLVVKHILCSFFILY